MRFVVRTPKTHPGEEENDALAKTLPINFTLSARTRIHGLLGMLPLPQLVTKYRFNELEHIYTYNVHAWMPH